MVKNIFKAFGISVLGATMAFALAGCDEEGSYVDGQPESEGEVQGVSTGDTIKIGALFPLTGDGAAYGVPLQRVAEIAVNKVNAEGGINGSNLEFIWEDGKCNGKDASSAVQKLINVDKVQVILGGFCSSETLGAAPLAEQAGVVLFSPGSSSPDITNAGDYIFRNYPSDAAQGRIVGDIAAARGITKVGMLTEENDYTIGIDKVFSETVSAAGIEVVAETFLPTDTDFRTQITKLKGESVDAIFINPQTPPKADLLMKQLQEQGVADAQLFGNDVVMGYAEGISRYADLVEGMIGAQASYEKDHPDFVAFSSEYTEKFGEELPYPSYSATTYDAVFILKDGLSAGGNSADAFKSFLYGISGRQGTAGSLTIDTNGDPGEGHRPEIVKGGVIVPYEG